MSDLCYPKPILNRVLRQAETMDRMVSHVGADPAVALRREKGAAWFEARTRCIDCTHDRQCQSWLAKAEHAGLEPQFCPNGKFLVDCKPQ